MKVNRLFAGAAFLFALLLGAAGAQQSNDASAAPPVGQACAYNSVLPTINDGKAGWLQCDARGRLIISNPGSGSGGTGGGAVYGPDQPGATPTQPGVLQALLDASGNVRNVSPTFPEPVANYVGGNPVGPANPYPTADQNAAQTISNAGTSGAKAQTIQGTPGGVPVPVSQAAALKIDQTTPGANNIQQVDGLTQTLSASAAGALTNATYPTGAIPTAGFASLSVQITGAGTGNTVSYERSNDGVTWYTTFGISSASSNGSTAPSSTDTTTTYREFSVAANFFRIRISTYGSGTVTAVVTMKVTNIAPIANYVTLASQGTTPIGVVGVNASTSANGLSNFSRIPSSAASTNATLAKASAGRTYKFYACNTTTTAKYIRLFNKATAPVPGTDTPVWSRALPGSATAGQPLCQSFDVADIGYYFSAGIGYDITGANPDLDTTALAAGDVIQVSVEYQ